MAPSFENSKIRRNLCGQVVHDLGCKILSGQLVVGEPLPQEVTLCETLGVSRTVIREAIKSLAAKGLVESRAKRGTIVLPARSWNYLDPEVLDWQSQADPGGQLLFHLTEFRLTIEPAAAAMAAERGNAEQLREIQDACNEMAANENNLEEFLSADRKFHTAILHATGNPFFSPVVNVISISLAISLRVTNRQPSDNRTSVPMHEKVAKAIVARKPDEARAAMESLLGDATERIAKVLKKD